MDITQLLLIAVGLMAFMVLGYMGFAGPSPAKEAARRLQGLRYRHSDSTVDKVEAQLKKGPIGLLFIPVLQAGGVVQDGFTLQFNGERRLDILHDPIQWLRGQIMDRGRAAVMRSLAQRRRSFCAPWAH